jgi:hypothetical protein
MSVDREGDCNYMVMPVSFCFFHVLEWPECLLTIWSNSMEFLVPLDSWPGYVESLC